MKETGIRNFIYQIELDKVCFRHDWAYGDFKDLPGRTAADNVLGDKAFNIAKNPKYDAYQRGLTCMVYTFFDKKIPDGVFESKIMSTQQLADELHQSIITNFEKRKAYSSFTDNIWGDDLAK